MKKIRVGQEHFALVTMVFIGIGLIGHFLAFAGERARAASDDAPTQTKTWAGSTENDFWTSNVNWAGIGGAQPGDDLVFPGDTLNTLNTNNFPVNTAFRSIRFDGTGCSTQPLCGYRIIGNQIILNSQLLSNVPVGPAPTFEPNIILGDDILINNFNANPAAFTLKGVVNLNGHSLELNSRFAATNLIVNGSVTGTGTIQKTGPGTVVLNGLSPGLGTTTVEEGTLRVGGSVGRVNLSTGMLQGAGAIGDIVANGAPANATIDPGAGSNNTGILSASSITMAPTSTVAIDLNGTIAGTSYDRLNVNGQNVFLNGANLVVRLGFSPAAGQQFTIINETGAGIVAGQFAQGNSITVNGQRFSIAYTSSSVVLTAVAPTITGTVTYGNAIGAPTARFVSNVAINGSGSPNVSGVTAAPGATAGQYSLIGFGAGSYTITPSKTGGVNSSITSFDAARIAQHVAGTNSLTGNQLFVADVSGTNGISSFDAGEVARYVAGFTTQIGSSGTWIFNPVLRTHATISADIIGEDYSAFLMGEVSGNWTNTGARPVGGRGGLTEKSIAINAPQLVTPTDNDIIVPLTVVGVADKGIISYEFNLRYNPSVIQPQANPVDIAGTISSKLSAVANAEEPGLLRVVVYGATPIEGNGVLLNLRFTTIGAPGSVSPLTWERIMLNEGDSQTTAADGQVELSAAAPDQAEISGHLLTAMGQSVPNARVTLTDTAGNVRSMLSNGSGIYRFGGLTAGQTYTVSVASKRYSFTPLTVSVADQPTSVDMIAE